MILFIPISQYIFFTVIIAENGTPGASSYRHADYEPKYAFQNWKKYWLSKKGMPQSIWMRYPTEHKVAKIGFTPEWNDMAPDWFDIVGSTNCTEPWTTLRSVKSSGFPNDFYGAGIKVWNVPERKRRSFRCIGLNIQNVLALNYKYVALKNLKMWE